MDNQMVKSINHTVWSNNNKTAITLLRGYGHTFKVTYDNTNGFPQTMDLKVLTKEGTFKYVANMKDIGFVPVSYVSKEDEMNVDNIEFVFCWYKYIDLVFGGEQ